MKLFRNVVSQIFALLDIIVVSMGLVSMTMLVTTVILQLLYSQWVM